MKFSRLSIIKRFVPQLVMVVWGLVCLPDLSPAAEPISDVATCHIHFNHQQAAASQMSCATDAELGELRAGYLSGNGLVIGFGFERLIKINGETAEHISVALPALNVGENLRIVPVSRLTNLDELGIVPATQLLGSIRDLNDMMVNVIQNQSDDTLIEHLRVLNVHIDGVGIARNWESQRQLFPALIEQLRL